MYLQNQYNIVKLNKIKFKKKKKKLEKHGLEKNSSIKIIFSSICFKNTFEHDNMIQTQKKQYFYSLPIMLLLYPYFKCRTNWSENMNFLQRTTGSLLDCIQITDT